MMIRLAVIIKPMKKVLEIKKIKVIKNKFTLNNNSV